MTVTEEIFRLAVVLLPHVYHKCDKETCCVLEAMLQQCGCRHTTMRGSSSSRS